MQAKEWILVDTETTGLIAPIMVVELAAQRMRGWEPQGIAFRRLLNQNADISPEASRVNGYTREILERDGERAPDVYRDFAAYVRELPIVAYNLKYDLEDVLKPEWGRLGVKPIGTTGFCALRLAQKLLDPVPAGNCKLQTLRQYYRLPERGAHTAMGDVETVIDLLKTVLRPIADDRGLVSWDDIRAFTEEEWFPSRLAFGKFKGRDFHDAHDDRELMSWLTWLSESSNELTAKMGKWYLTQLSAPKTENSFQTSTRIFDQDNAHSKAEAHTHEIKNGITLYKDLEVERLRAAIAAARARLADLEAQFTKDKCAIDHVQATIFNQLREHYQARDRIKLIVEYRYKYLNTLLADGDEQAEQVANQYNHARADTDSNYENAGAACNNKRMLSEANQESLNVLWRKLVNLFHPDRFATQPDKKATYENLTAAINQARDDGDVELLREIADDPNAFLLRQGWSTLNLNDEIDIKALTKLYATLQVEIVNLLEMLNTLRESSDFELLALNRKNPGLVDDIVQERKKALSEEIAALEAEAALLQREISELDVTADERIA